MSDAPGDRALVVPVGGSPAAPANAIRRVRPKWVAFLASETTEKDAEDVLAGLDDPPKWTRCIVTPDPQNLNATFRVVDRALPGILEEWRVGWDRVVVDLTGGTKVMIAALVLATIHRAPRYLYIGGDKRDEGDKGKVVDGHETPIETQNPWQELAVEHERRIAWAFNNLQFGDAERRAEEARRLVPDERRAWFRALLEMIRGYAAWDRFDHAAAHDALKRCVDVAAMESARVPDLRHLPAELRAGLETLEAIRSDRRDEAPSAALLRDLLANARRRGEIEKRYDDAVARLYRVVEGVAQQALWDAHGIRSSAVPLDALPGDPAWAPVRAEAERAGTTTVKLPLLRSYELLRHRGDPLGSVAVDLRGGALGSLLTARNASLLAHGVIPVGEKSYRGLWDACLRLVGCTEADLVRFPRLPED